MPRRQLMHTQGGRFINSLRVRHLCAVSLPMCSCARPVVTVKIADGLHGPVTLKFPHRAPTARRVSVLRTGEQNLSNSLPDHARFRFIRDSGEIANDCVKDVGVGTYTTSDGLRAGVAVRFRFDCQR